MADVESIRRVASRIAEAHESGQSIVAVVSAMGDTTDDLLKLARSISRNPARRELDMLLSAGERISMALLSLALNGRDVPAVSFTGSQSGIITNDAHTNARIIEVRPVRVQDELARGRVVIVAGYQGVSYKRWPAAPGPAVAERVRISLSDVGELDRLARRLSEPMSSARPWAGLELIDSGISLHPVVAVIAAGGPAEAAGMQVGESLITVAGNQVATVAGAASWLSTFAPGAMVALGVRGPAGDRTLELRMGSTPTVVGPTEPDRLYSVMWGMTAAAVGRMDAPAPTWLAQLNQAAVLLHVRDWQAAAELLGAIQAPAGAGVGQGLVDYWLGIALAEAGDPDAARAAFERVLDSPQARYLRNDGPYLAPMARARVLAIDALRSP